ncbi:hypothetical protein Q0F99_19120 [Rathayibacter oskolensis]|uniref:hypothetical protein n=1 Tax=Rathayibacter oskolensis TaxID=1891671 RepID=UPI00265F82A5|nr:hypothetical protein [Rathayibacter oskolensis]WKK71452.1 hypothetical protein Q0F99_19120 [Rathayibacter oskolensis]
MAEIVVTIEGGEELAARIRKFGSSILDLTDAMNDVADYLVGFFSGEVFVSRGGVIGKPWQPLSDAYALEKAHDFPGRPPLIASGAMNEGFRFTANRNSVGFYNTEDYFYFHDEGRGVPLRKMMDVDRRRLTRIGQFIEQDLDPEDEAR